MLEVKYLDYYGKLDLIVYYLISINLIGIITYALDKHRARRNKWRIPEKSLMTLAIIGGSIGCLVGMYVMRHKTQKKKFTVGVPVILILQVILIFFIF